MSSIFRIFCDFWKSCPQILNISDSKQLRILLKIYKIWPKIEGIFYFFSQKLMTFQENYWIRRNFSQSPSWGSLFSYQRVRFALYSIARNFDRNPNRKIVGVEMGKMRNSARICQGLGRGVPDRIISRTWQLWLNSVWPSELIRTTPINLMFGLRSASELKIKILNLKNWNSWKFHVKLSNILMNLWSI